MIGPKRFIQTNAICIFKVKAWLTYLVALTSILNAENTYWEQYSSKPVFIEQSMNGRNQTLKFIAFRDDMIVVEMEMRNNDGSTSTAEIAQPANEGMVKNLNFKVKAMENANRLISSGNHAAAAEALRPQVYPLIKFHRIPETFIQLHQPIRLLLDALIDAGELDEAQYLIKQIALDKVDFKYSERAQKLLKEFEAEKNFTQLAKLVAQLPATKNYTENIPSITKAADILRSAEYYDAVIPLYRTLQDAVTSKQLPDINLWLAYSLILAGESKEANALIETLEKPDPSERLFSLYQLLQGSRMHRQEQYGLALDTLTRGFVRAQSSYSWVPEMLYLIGDCYLRDEQPITARNVWVEVTALYPNSPWAKRVQLALDKLPKTETKL